MWARVIGINGKFAEFADLSMAEWFAKERSRHGSSPVCIAYKNVSTGKIFLLSYLDGKGGGMVEMRNWQDLHRDVELIMGSAREEARRFNARYRD